MGTTTSKTTRLVRGFCLVMTAACATEPSTAHTKQRPPCVTAVPPSDWTYPGGKTGTNIGDVIADFTLPDGDGKDVRFGDVLGDAKVVLLNVGSGWCQPCVDETEHLDNDVYRKHCKEGLRVIQVLYQDEQSKPAPALFVRQWRDRFGLTFPVLQDALFETSRFFTNAASQTPLNLLVDAEGVIRYKRTGEVPKDLDAEISALLQE